jgi:hypothetical protein
MDNFIVLKTMKYFTTLKKVHEVNFDEIHSGIQLRLLDKLNIQVLT